MSDRYSRQGFLGESGQRAIETCRMAVCGLGGGGSHIAPQAARVGFQNFALFDPDIGEESNLHRTMTLMQSEIARGTLKVEAAKSRILEINQAASVEAYPCRWQEKPEKLRTCDIIFGCVDSFTERQQLEAFCRRYLIPYIDMGMDIHLGADGSTGISGQVILSMPGGPCMFCMHFLTEERLGREANNYGALGGRPQVVWSNGVLASTAVGVGIDLLTGWSRSKPGPVYLSYRGNDGTLVPHVRLNHLAAGHCPHYLPQQVGDPVFRSVQA